MGIINLANNEQTLITVAGQRRGRQRHWWNSHDAKSPMHCRTDVCSLENGWSLNFAVGSPNDGVTYSIEDEMGGNVWDYAVAASGIAVWSVRDADPMLLQILQLAEGIFEMFPACVERYPHPF